MHGTLAIESSPGKGTSISAIIPLLDALPSKEEQERRQLKLRRMVEQAGFGIPLTSSAITISGVLGGGKHSASLTEREKEVLRQLAQDRTNPEIAAVLVVSEETIKTHVGNILTRLQLAHRTQAVIYALKKGLISLDEIDLP